MPIDPWTDSRPPPPPPPPPPHFCLLLPHAAFPPSRLGLFPCPCLSLEEAELPMICSTPHPTQNQRQAKAGAQRTFMRMHFCVRNTDPPNLICPSRASPPCLACPKFRFRFPSVPGLVSILCLCLLSRLYGARTCELASATGRRGRGGGGSGRSGGEGCCNRPPAAARAFGERGGHLMSGTCLLLPGCDASPRCCLRQPCCSVCCPTEPWLPTRLWQRACRSRLRDCQKVGSL